MRAFGRWVQPVLAACLASALFCRLAETAFRHALPVSDIPYWKGEPVLGYRHVPRLAGRFASGAFDAHFRLNNRGWNSPSDYSISKGESERHVAILGDSYVEALQVSVGKGLGPQLERLLNEGAGDQSP